MRRYAYRDSINLINGVEKVDSRCGRGVVKAVHYVTLILQINGVDVETMKNC